MKKTILMILITFFIGTQRNFAQEKLTENQKLETLCKVWGFLKYYHPIVAKGTYDWDNQLIEKIKESEKIDTKKQFNKMLSSWIDGLGKVEICKTCNEPNDKKYFLKNFDLSWADDEKVFSKDVIKKLNFIEENRNLGENFYVNDKKDEKGYFTVYNEKDNKDFSDKNTRLLELFKYWNLIEYFFPYKYLMDKKWNDVLIEFIPKISSVNNRKDYLLTLAELISNINDSHANFMTLKGNEFFGKGQIPAKTKFIENKLIVTDLYETKTPYINELQKYDIITKIDGKTPEEIQNYYKKIVPVSNLPSLLVKISHLYLYSFKDKIEIEILRDNKIIKKEIPTIEYSNVIYPKIALPKEKWKFINEKTGLVNIGVLEKEDIDKMFSEFKNLDYIIFDYRIYPKGTGYLLSQKLYPNRIEFSKFTYPDYTYPGKFYFEENTIKNKNNDIYNGKIIILINENTQSQGEFCSMIMQGVNAKVIGSQTAGADGTVRKLKVAGFPSGFSGIGVYYPDGRETQRIGIVPDIEVKPTIKGIKEGRDEVLERALEYIKTGK